MNFSEEYHLKITNFSFFGRELRIVNEGFCVKDFVNLEKTHFIQRTNCKSIISPTIKKMDNVFENVKKFGCLY